MANEYPPGFAFSAATSSPGDFAGKSLFAMIMIGSVNTFATGAKLAIGSNGVFVSRNCAISIDESPSISV